MVSAPNAPNGSGQDGRTATSNFYETPDNLDGIAEAHNAQREMFGFPRLKDTCAGAAVGQALIDRVLAEVEAFVGPDAEQEDDITLVTLVRASRDGTEPLR